MFIFRKKLIESLEDDHSSSLFELLLPQEFN